MISEAIQELKRELQRAGGGSLSPASTQDLEQARQFGFPEVLLDLYRENAPDATDGRVELDQRIWSVQNAITENRDYVPGGDLFPLGYVVFASNKYGDAYCLDTIHVGSADGEDVEPFRLAVASGLEDFLLKFARRTLIGTPKYE